jgi:hypothetical protein
VAKFKDFDEALEADKDERVQIKVAGKSYELPATLPARTVLTQMRFQTDGNQIPMDVIPDWIESLVGKNNYEDMLDNGMTWNQMNEVLAYLLEIYGLTPAGDEAVGETVDTEEDSEDPK